MRKIKSFQELKYNLYKEIKRGRLLDVNRVERGIGKSYLLSEIAKENDYIIIVRYGNLARMFNKEQDTDRYYTISMLNTLRGKRLKGVLLEEGLTLEEEKEVRRLFNVVGGYSLNYKGDKYDS